MSFAIFRIDKKKNAAQILRTANHHLRTQPVSNADPTRSIEVLAGPESAADVAEIINEVTKPLAKRHDAVRCFDALMTASPEFFTSGGSVDTFKKYAMDWAADTFGGDNIVSAVMHLDETTPHIQLLVTPIKDGKLKATEWTGGPKKMRALQDSYAKAMEPLGLKRGVKFSNAEHKDISTWYGELEPKMAEAKAVIEQAPVIQQQIEQERNKVKAEKKKVFAEGIGVSREKLELWSKERELDAEKKEIKAERLALAQERSILEKLVKEVTELKQSLYGNLKAMREVWNDLPNKAKISVQDAYKRYLEMPAPPPVPPEVRHVPVSDPDPAPLAPAPKPR